MISKLEQIIKEELVRALNEGWLDKLNPFKKKQAGAVVERAPIDITGPKEQKWNEFASNYGQTSWFEKDGMKAMFITQDHPELTRPAIEKPQVVDRLGLGYKHMSHDSEGNVTIITDIPVSGGASSFDTDGDGDVDKLDPEAVRRALEAGLPSLKSAMGSQWTAERAMEEFGDAPVMVDDDEFKTALEARLSVVKPKSEQEAENVFDEMYEIFQQRSSNY